MKAIALTLFSPSCGVLLFVAIHGSKERQYAKDKAAIPRELYQMVEKLQAHAFGQVTSLSTEAIEAIQLELSAASLMSKE